jgi:hypothetical protein
LFSSSVGSSISAPQRYSQLKTAGGFQCIFKTKKDTPVERSGKFLETNSKYNATILSFFSGKASNGATKKWLSLSGTASRIMLRVMSKRQKMTVVGTCPYDNLSCSRNLKNYYFFSHQTKTIASAGISARRMPLGRTILYWNF